VFAVKLIRVKAFSADMKKGGNGWRSLLQKGRRKLI